MPVASRDWGAIRLAIRGVHARIKRANYFFDFDNDDDQLVLIIIFYCLNIAHIVVIICSATFISFVDIIISLLS